MSAMLRRAAEEIFADELVALAKSDQRERPANWKIDRKSVV